MVIQLGDIGNICACVSSLLFIALVTGTSGLMSPSFLKEGFCISNAEKIWTSSHSASVCLNISFAVVLYSLLRRCRNKQLSNESCNLMAMNIPIIVLHGMSHLALTFVLNSNDAATINNLDRTVYSLFYMEYSFVTFFFMFDVTLLIWGVVLYGVMAQCNTAFSSFSSSASSVGSYIQENMDTVVFVLALFFTIIQVSLVPLRHSNTYIHTCIILTTALCGIFSNSGGSYYTITVFTINLPMSIVSWIEAIGCDTFLIHIGGHLWSDILLVFSYLLYFFCVFLLETSKRGNHLKKKQKSS